MFTQNLIFLFACTSILIVTYYGNQDMCNMVKAAVNTTVLPYMIVTALFIELIIS